jgi:hypothetical protein
MHVVYAGALMSARTALTDLATALESIPDAAVDWTPVGGANSLTVLVRHSVTATRFLAASAAGLAPDRAAYIEKERLPSFRARGASVASLAAEVESLALDLPAIFDNGTDASLAAASPWPWPEGRHPSGAELLVHTVAHLREHVGVAQLMRDLWLAGSREGR